MACLVGPATCFIIPTILPSVIANGRNPRQARTTLQVGVGNPQSRRLSVAYVLVKDPVDVHLDTKNDPFRVQHIKMDAKISTSVHELIQTCNDAVSAQDKAQAICRVSELPVAVEMEQDGNDGGRTFIMPGNVTVHLRERSYSQSGLGGSLWGSGIGLAILLAQGARRLPHGIRLLELGSGVGLTGISCAIGGAVATLSDWGEGTQGGGGSAVGAPLNPKASPLTSAVPANVLDPDLIGIDPAVVVAAAVVAVAEGGVDSGKQKHEDNTGQVGSSYSKLNQPSLPGLPGLPAGDSESIGQERINQEKGGTGAVDQAKEILRAALGEGGGGLEAATIAVKAMMDSRPKALLANLGYSVALNGLEGRAQVRHLDWHSALAPSFEPDQTFDVNSRPPPVSLTPFHISLRFCHSGSVLFSASVLSLSVSVFFSDFLSLSLSLSSPSHLPSLSLSLAPSQQAVIGSDLIYYKRDAAALAATIVSHTSRAGVAHLMCRRGRRGLVEVVDLLRAQGEVKEEAYTLFPLRNDDSGRKGEGGVTVEEGEPIVHITFRFAGGRK